MSEAIEIILDRADRTYSAGEIIRGAVHLPDPGGKVLVLTEWRTAGRSREYREEGERYDLDPSGAAIPFEIPAPPGPPTYAGKEFEIHWRILARVERGGEHPKEASTELVLNPGDEGKADYVGPDLQSMEKTRTEKGSFSLGFFGTCGTICAVLGLVGPVILILTWSHSHIASKIFLGLWSLGSIFALFFAVVALRHAILAIPPHRKLGRVPWSIEPTRLRRGGVIRCDARMKPRKDCVLEKVEATLTATEKVEDDDEKESEKEVLKKSFFLARDLSLLSGEEYPLKEEILVPSDGPWTIAAPSNEVEWDFALEIKLEGHESTWTASRKIIVLP